MNSTAPKKVNPKQVARSAVNDLDPYLPGRPIKAQGRNKIFQNMAPNF
nr:hypothetical protein [uncultured Desulfobacter sp.]